MRKHWAAAVFLLLSVTATSQARNDDAGVRKELNASYHRMDQALSGSGGQQLISAIDDTLAKGPYRDELMLRAKHTMAAGGDKERVRTIQIKTTITKLAVSGNVALVNIFQKGDLIQKDMTGEFGPKGATHHLTGGGYYLDKWVKQAGKWRLLSETFQNETMFVDGKKMPSPSN
ncbi:hypothetical protein CCAX7_20820 [Capsulimonas corticalis]|uniref:Uncharacterized protein n=1 Tax=Capsulimonas corticalis TaxID=2219043 RepID=A0A402D299_9BACT|nr:nuclear transport factor 2 family protein [Capsulimonas corticalis]BDI30031.1 hypothetical protein CCAX7_20820 [Capsulimonas corticalis]